MKQELSAHLPNGLAVIAGVSATTTGVMGWLNYYAAGIGVIFTVLTFFAWLFFQIRHDKKLAQVDENKRQIELIQAQTTKNFDRIEGVLKQVVSEIKKSNSDKQG